MSHKKEKADHEKADKKNEHGEVRISHEEHKKLLAQGEELVQLKDKLMRSAADYENAKKRLARERDEFVKFGQENLLRSLVPVLDNFERALNHADETKPEGIAALVSGIRMVLKQLNDALKSQGLQRIESVGKHFDPHIHEAIGFVQEEGKEDEIVEEVEPGYMLHDRLLRAPKVRVRLASSKGSPASSGEGNGPDPKEDEIT